MKAEYINDLKKEIEGWHGGLAENIRELIAVWEREKRLETLQHEPIVMPPLSIKAKRTMPMEMVVREEYEQIKAFYKDVYHLLASMNYDPSAKNVNELLNHAKAFVDKHEY